jgi:hypothetical protein
MKTLGCVLIGMSLIGSCEAEAVMTWDMPTTRAEEIPKETDSACYRAYAARLRLCALYNKQNTGNLCKAELNNPCESKQTVKTKTKKESKHKLPDLVDPIQEALDKNDEDER